MVILGRTEALSQRSDRCRIDDGTVREQVSLDVLSERES
jgi:hypothetical protein